MLEEAGWKQGADGVRAKDGKKLKFVFQTSINAPRQKTQAIVKQACQKAGIEIELKSVVASVFFSSDVANPDTYAHFYSTADVHDHDDASPTRACSCASIYSRKSRPRRTSGRARNISRWHNKDYDEVFDAAERELDPVKRAALFIKCNDLVWQDHVVIPVVHRAEGQAPLPTS